MTTTPSNNSGQVLAIRSLREQIYEYFRGEIQAWALINCDEHDAFIQFLKAGQPEKAAALWRDRHWSFSAHETCIREFYAQGNRQIEDVLNGQHA